MRELADLVGLIDAALGRRGWSARRASIEATGAAHLVARIRRGQDPSVMGRSSYPMPNTGAGETH